MTAALPDGFTELRPHQVDAIDEIVELFNEGVEIVYLDAPTGSGKTLIGHQVARELDAQTLYVCSDKSLQDQFARDFPHGKVLKGRSNYRVGVRDQFTAADCTSGGRNDPCIHCPGGRNTCPYEKAKREALAADLAVTNTAYLLHEANGPGGFSGRDLVIVDEGDTLESLLMGFVEFSTNSTVMKKLGMEHPKKGVHKRTIVAWLDEYITGCRDQVNRMDKMADPQKWNEWSRAMGKAINMRDNLVQDIEKGAEGEDKGYWIRDYPWSKTGDPGLVLKPIHVARYGVRNLWQHGQRWLIMSATIISSDEMSQSLGVVEDYETVTVPMTFPVENRPIILAPIADVTYNNMDEAVKNLVHAIVVAADKHPGERMIVHTVSYKLARDLELGLKKQLRDRRIVTYSEGRHRETALATFKKTKGAIMLAPSMSRGIDLPDDLCRVQIIAKCPFPALGDKQISARLHAPGGQLWYTVKTIRDIVQMTGRAVRHKDDWAVTYIFDKSFTSNLWRKWKNLFPEWWRESVDTRVDVREFIRRGP